MNTELLLAVKAAILEHPEKYDQDSFCGTECCIAGWALNIANPVMGARREQGISAVSMNEQNWNDYWEVARKNMGLGCRQMAILCACAPDWPSVFRHGYESATDAEQRATVGAARIDHFIATNGAE